MTFLTPISAIVAAAVATPLLVALYLLKLRRRPVRVGSTMLWAQAAEDLQANVPFRWLRPSLLLLLQLLVLACLVLALGRPAVRVAGAMPDQVFVLIDRSASMRATDSADAGSRFESALRLAGEAIDRAAIGSFGGEITLITFASSAEIVAGPTRSKGELRSALAALTPSDEPGNLGEALRLVRGLTPDDETESAPPPLVYVCSDGAGPPDLPAIAARVVLLRPELAPGASGNVGFVALAARRDDRSPSVVRVFARVQSTLSEPTPVTVVVRSGGEVVRREVLDLEPAGDDGPGQTPLSLGLDVPGRGLVELVIDRRDALAADNAVAFTVGAPRRAGVLLVRSSEQEEAGSGWLLTDVLRELDLASLTLLSADRLRAIGPDAYSDVDLVIFDGVAPASLPPVPTLHFGAPPAIDGLTSREVASGVAPVIAWDRGDPLMRDVSLDALRVGRTIVFQPDESARGYRELARTGAGAVVAAINAAGHRRVLVGFELSQSTWPLHYSFPLFMANAIDTLPRIVEATRGRSFATGRPVSLEGAGPAGSLPLRDPTGRVVRTVVAPSGGGPTRLGRLEAAGVWTLGDLTLPVNLLDEGESSLVSPASLPVGGGSEGPGSSAGLGTEPLELWPWLVLGAFVLLAAEWVLFGARVRV